MNDKVVLDACCGSRMFWFDKNNPLTVYMDFRSGEFVASNGMSNEVNPDIVGDFTQMPFADNSFSLVVFDPPHRSDLGKNSWMAHQYGRLLPSWETDIKAGFQECMRVLKNDGVLIFKWNEKEIKISKILSVIGQTPLFGDRRGKTIWMTFIKSGTQTIKTP